MAIGDECTCGAWCVGYTMPSCPVHSMWQSSPFNPLLVEQTAPVAPVTVVTTRLSDEDVERIAERVAEKLRGPKVADLGRRPPHISPALQELADEDS